MSMLWWKCKHGAPFDPKWRTIARRVSGRPGDVWAVASALFDAASQAQPRGSISKVDLEEIADGLGYDLEYVNRIHHELQDKNVHDGLFVLNFEKHQSYEDTTATLRKRRQRQREKEAPFGRDPHAGSHQVTGSHAHVTPNTVTQRDDNVTVTDSHASVTAAEKDEIRTDQNRSESEGPCAGGHGVETIPDALRRGPDGFEEFMRAGDWHPNTRRSETIEALRAEGVPTLPELTRAAKRYFASLSRNRRHDPAFSVTAANFIRKEMWREHPAPAPTPAAAPLPPVVVWDGHAAADALRAELSEPIFNTYFAPCALSMVDDVLPVLLAPSKFIADRISEKYSRQLDRAFGVTVNVGYARNEAT